MVIHGNDSRMGKGCLSFSIGNKASQPSVVFSGTVPDRAGTESVTHPMRQGCGGRGDMQGRGKVYLAEIAEPGSLPLGEGGGSSGYEGCTG